MSGQIGLTDDGSLSDDAASPLDAYFERNTPRVVIGCGVEKRRIKSRHGKGNRYLPYRGIRTADDLARAALRFHRQQMRHYEKEAGGDDGNDGSDDDDVDSTDVNDLDEDGEDANINGDEDNGDDNEDDDDDDDDNEQGQSKSWVPLWEFLSLSEFEDLLANLKTVHAAVASLSGGLSVLGTDNDNNSKGQRRNSAAAAKNHIAMVFNALDVDKKGLISKSALARGIHSFDASGDPEGALDVVFIEESSLVVAGDGAVETIDPSIDVSKLTGGQLRTHLKRLGCGLETPGVTGPPRKLILAQRLEGARRSANRSSGISDDDSELTVDVDAFERYLVRFLQHQFYRCIEGYVTNRAEFLVLGGRDLQGLALEVYRMRAEAKKAQLKEEARSLFSGSEMLNASSVLLGDLAALAGSGMSAAANMFSPW